MTNQETIEVMREIREYMAAGNAIFGKDDNFIQACSLAIQALSAADTMIKFDEYMQKTIDGYDMIVSQFCLDNACDWLEKNGVDSTNFRKCTDMYSTGEIS